MLAALQIRDIVLIDSVDLSFADGLSVLTGETGAGKSIILDALGLALGSRADRSLVRAGTKSGSVTAVFELPADHPALLLARDSGLVPEACELILRRVITEDGRARAFVNDAPVSQGLLKALGDRLVEIHGQHDGERLLDPVMHRQLLDAFGGHTEAVAAVAKAFERWTDAKAAYARHETEMAAAARDADYIAHAADELEALDPKEGEETALASERAGFAQGAKLADAVADAQGQIRRDGGVSDRLGQVLRRLERIGAGVGSLAPVLEALERAFSEAVEAESLLEAFAREQTFDPKRLERIEERLFALRAAARKFNVHPDGLAALRDDFLIRRAGLTQGEAHGAKLEAEANEARVGYLEAASALRALRVAAGCALDAAVMKELKPLKLETAIFATEVEPVDEPQWSAGGTERARFLVATNPGAALGALSKIASGGERARFFLALKVVLARGTEAATLIFDEVDQGVGGAVATAVGERLSRLAAGAQVLVVTHSPQVAAKAHHHFRILKAQRKRGEAALVTRVEELDALARREEIARMLSGTEVTNEARAAAEKLIAGTPAQKRATSIPL